MERMAPKVVSNNFGEVRIYQVKRNSYEVRYKIGKHLKRKTRKNLKLAEAEAERILKSFETNSVIQPTNDELQIFRYISARAAKAGVDLLEVWKFWETHGVRLTDHPIGQVVKEFLDHQIARGISPVTVRTNRSRLTPLVFSFGNGQMPMPQITTALLDTWLEKNFPNLVSRLNERKAIVQLWEWATKKGYLPEKSFTEAEKTAVPRVASKDPEIYTAEEMQLIFQWLYAHAPMSVPHLLLAAWSGVRDAEIRRVTWGMLDLENGILPLPASITKTNRRRIATIPRNAVEILKRFRKAYPIKNSDPISTTGVNNFGKALDALKIQRRKNGIRKSYVSHAVALGEKTVAQVAEECGHAVAILQTHYKGLVDKDEARRWFRIPSSV